MTVAFDTETHLIEPGLLAPPLVCAQWTVDGDAPSLVHRANTYERVIEWLESDHVLVGHNIAYDMGVIAAQYPWLMPLILRAYNQDRVTDTQIREQLIMIARGEFRSYADADGDLHPVKYSLADCVRRHFSTELKKDGWRLFYRAFDQTPNTLDWHEVATRFQDACRRGEWPDWASAVTDKDRQGLLAARPEEAVLYALEDARVTHRLYESQRTHFSPDTFTDEFRQARAAFALHLSSCWGIYTDKDAVDQLEVTLRAELETLQSDLMAEGLIRENGTADTKAAAQAMETACGEDGIPVIRTKGGKVSLSHEACERFDEGSIIRDYSRFLQVRKQLSNDIAMLRAGCDVPIQPRYDMADTGRCRASKPGIQAISRGNGIREAFRPRPGTVFIQSDFEGLELHCMAVWCLEKFGHSAMADALNAGRDVHLDTAASLMGITYEEALPRKKELKDQRQKAKAINFGYPGGLGAKKLVRYAWTQFGVKMTEGEAAQAKLLWLRRYPEFIDFFATAARGGEEETHIFTGRKRGGLRYSALCNGRFQGLGADAAKEALWRVTEATYTPGSPLYGAHVVAFVHDEIIMEIEEERCHEGAMELGRLMRAGADLYLGRVPVRLEPLAMRLWSKKAEPVYKDGRLIPWEP
jgi:DNA polymerase I-like protein with 3'-5' exonuclease and polymerase domains